jgi:NAD(P)-dependent dehydrogenase (short-subunit alcohol dehydrogenase family)
MASPSRKTSTADRFPKNFLGRLSGKTAIVTGAGTKGEGYGTGRAIALLFAGEGARVCLVDRDLDAAIGTLRYIKQIGGDAFVAVGDVTAEADCARFVADTSARYGGVDILVNNVGIASRSSRADGVELSDWQRIISVNLDSAILMAKAAMPSLRERGDGVIVNIASIAGMLGYGGLAYGSSKAALIQLTRDLAVVHGRDGIRVNAIAPGHIYTPLVEGLLPEEIRETRRKIGPLGVEGDAWDIASAALFLASGDARFITGACLPVDGGVTITGSMEALRLASDPS